MALDPARALAAWTALRAEGRKDALRIIGNGVVPQAVAAARLYLEAAH